MAKITTGPPASGGSSPGSVVPTANATGVTLDATTYDDPIAGGGAKLRTLLFTGDQGAIAIAVSGDAHPRWLIASDAADGFYFGNGAVDPYSSDGCYFSYGTGGVFNISAKSGQRVHFGGIVSVGAAAAAPEDVPKMSQVSPAFGGTINSANLVSGTAHQFSTASDVETHTPVTFTPGVATSGTCAIEVSPDNMSFTQIAILTVPAGTALDGFILDGCARVPGGWYLRLTVNAQATLGQTLYY